MMEPVRQLLILVRVKVGICVQRGLHGFMPQSFRNLQWGKAHFNQHTGVGVSQIVDSYDGQPYFGSYSFYFLIQGGFREIEYPIPFFNSLEL